MFSFAFSNTGSSRENGLESVQSRCGEPEVIIAMQGVAAQCADRIHVGDIHWVPGSRLKLAQLHPRNI